MKIVEKGANRAVNATAAQIAGWKRGRYVTALGKLWMVPDSMNKCDSDSPFRGALEYPFSGGPFDVQPGESCAEALARYNSILNAR